MSKFLKIMMVVALVAAMVAPAVAEDRLSLGGQVETRAWVKDDGTNTTSFMDSRFRLGAKFTIAEGVTATLRQDFSESDTWGFTEGTYGRVTPIQVDRAHLDITKGMFHVRAGQQNVVLGDATVDAQANAVVFDVKTAAPIQVGYMILNANEAAKKQSLHTDDKIVFGAISHKTDMYSAKLFVANANDQTDGTDVLVAGLAAKMNLNAIALDTELDFFTGDANAAETVDAMGTQLKIDASMAVSDTVTAGGVLYYALAQGTDEMQFTTLGNGFNGTDPANYGPLSNEELYMPLNRVFDFTGTGAGVIGLQGYAKAKVNDALAVTGSAAYLMPEDDKVTGPVGDQYNSAILLNAGLTYQVMANAKIKSQLQYVVNDDDADTDNQMAAGLGLYVNF